ncbi:hypothetical protein ACIBK9_43035 [Nonomuraea sp. NPDC050227]|uniref:hypothetical protein n=1 Tax=Nonomuraea sp. NPDC050227 TaxID=3364360 RepID=UPI0037A2CBD4
MTRPATSRAGSRPSQVPLATGGRYSATWTSMSGAAAPVRNMGSACTPNSAAGSVTASRRSVQRGCMRHSSTKEPRARRSRPVTGAGIVNARERRSAPQRVAARSAWISRLRRTSERAR